MRSPPAPAPSRARRSRRGGLAAARLVFRVGLAVVVREPEQRGASENAARDAAPAQIPRHLRADGEPRRLHAEPAHEQLQFHGSRMDTPQMGAGAFECPVHLLLVSVAAERPLQVIIPNDLTGPEFLNVPG